VRESINRDSKNSTRVKGRNRIGGNWSKRWLVDKVREEKVSKKTITVDRSRHHIIGGEKNTQRMRG